MAVGLVIVRLCTTIPHLGGWVKFAAMLWGIGAISLALYRRFQPMIAPARQVRRTRRRCRRIRRWAGRCRREEELSVVSFQWTVKKETENAEESWFERADRFCGDAEKVRV